MPIMPSSSCQMRVFRIEMKKSAQRSKDQQFRHLGRESLMNISCFNRRVPRVHSCMKRVVLFVNSTRDFPALLPVDTRLGTFFLALSIS